ncbi:helix-turn-helix domain-containing protein [Segetibacter aerophilus]|nr:AraC family transcriptional regulator [Segetibacter aerophilus]
MITNYFIAPHPALKLFIANYILSTSDEKHVKFKSFWPASAETGLIFHLADRPEHITNDSSKLKNLQNKNSCLIGVLSNFNGIFSFSGIYRRFTIQFKANGFYKLFGMPFSEFSNKIFSLDEVFGKSAMLLQEQLVDEKELSQMADYADKFLLAFLNRQKSQYAVLDGITAISNKFNEDLSLSNITRYAEKANMSVRNFERRFIEQVGISPKLYSRLLRFNNAIITRLKHPESNWTSIAYECGYYDQMHMIKDFKQFANLNPSNLLQPNTDFTRPLIDVTNSNLETWRRLTSNLPYEKFVPVQRFIH